MNIRIRPKHAMTFALALGASVFLTGCPMVKPFARTALEAARHACAVYAEQTGVTFEDICKTEQQLQPFLDAILASQAAAAAQKTGAKPCECPECPKTEEPKAEPPKAEPAPAPAPAPAPVEPPKGEGK